METNNFNESKFTKGDWSSKDGLISASGDANTICSVNSIFMSDEEHEANCRIISAAPKLLYELQKMIQVFEPYAKEAQYASGIFMAKAEIKKIIG